MRGGGYPIQLWLGVPPGWGYPYPDLIQTRPGMGYPPTFQTWLGGDPRYPSPDLGWGTPHPDLQWGTPLPIQTWLGVPLVPPIQTWDGVPPIIQTWPGGTPSPDLGWGTSPSRPGMGYPLPRPGMGYPPPRCGLKNKQKTVPSLILRMRAVKIVWRIFTIFHHIEISPNAYSPKSLVVLSPERIVVNLHNCASFTESVQNKVGVNLVVTMQPVLILEDCLHVAFLARYLTRFFCCVFHYVFGFHRIK